MQILFWMYLELFPERFDELLDNTSLQKLFNDQVSTDALL